MIDYDRIPDPVQRFFVAGSLSVAYLLVWKALISNVNGEVAYLHLGGMLALVLAGPGKYSVDYYLSWQHTQ